ncbi:MAG: bifunctional folylpolyglutamate synthase/dihydrofolate synthase [Exilispira sp.]
MHKFDDFDKALDWIYSFTNLERNHDKRKNKSSFQLLPISKMNQYFGNPIDNIKTIHVAGSKGKGTVSYILSKYFQLHGLKVGLYTSPHIFNPRERIKINDKMIEIESFLTILNDIQEYVINIKNKEEIPSYFDIFTELAFLYFFKEKVDLAIIEVGLGGRLDSTNIINPLISVITSITFEHTEVLGKTLKKIAKEKAGIIKEGKPVILSMNKKDVFNTIKLIADKNKSPFYYSKDFVKVDFIGFKKEGLKIMSKYKINLLKENEKKIILSRLIGDFQRRNIEAALISIIIACKLLKIRFNFNYIESLLKEAYFISRFEIKSYKGRTIIIDGAHTQESIYRLVSTIKKMINKNIINEKIAIITGMMKDKDHKGMLSILIKISSLFYFVELDKYKDSKVSNYIDIFKELIVKDSKKVDYFVQEGTNYKGINLLDKIIKYDNEINTILITGSLYLAQYFKDI